MDDIVPWVRVLDPIVLCPLLFLPVMKEFKNACK